MTPKIHENCGVYGKAKRKVLRKMAVAKNGSLISRARARVRLFSMRLYAGVLLLLGNLFRICDFESRHPSYAGPEAAETNKFSQMSKSQRIKYRSDCYNDFNTNSFNFSVVASKISKSSEWFIDSAATSTMCNNKSFFVKLNQRIEECWVYVANGERLRVRGIGQIS